MSGSKNCGAEDGWGGAGRGWVGSGGGEMETTVLEEQYKKEKKTVVRLHNGILCSRKKKELPPFATAWVELESIMLSKISQTVKDKYHTTSPLTGT